MDGLLRGGGEVKGLGGEALELGLGGSRAWRWMRWRRRRSPKLRLGEWTGARRGEERGLFSCWRAGVKHTDPQWGENRLLHNH